jgi:CRP-like cAMP-binding protein
MPNSAQREIHNHILAALPPEDYKRLAPYLELVEMKNGQILYTSGEHIEHVYFPLNSMVSLVSQTVDGESVEVGIVGYEGLTGISALLGVDKSAHQNIVQIHDGALRLTTKVLLEEFVRGGALQPLVLRYVQSLLLQVSQVAACNRLHTLSERLARWLLMSDDRCYCDDLPLTQEFLSLMLGTRRAGVTEAAIVLQSLGLIRYSRGHINILNRDGLVEYSCNCYSLLKEEFDQITK